MSGRIVGAAARLALLALVAGATACGPAGREAGSGEGTRSGEAAMAMRDIKVVQEEHAPALMARPGVVGVAIGALDDDSPCIVIYVATAPDSARLALPREIEGHPVRVEVTGEFRPLGK